MTKIPKAYEPNSVEDKWYDFWVKQDCFTADPARVSEKRPAYSIVIPPPNVTGMLHMGHVLNNTIQDILSRKARMDGKEVLWLPGTDHAGIATQVQVEKALKKEERKTKYDIGREEFLKRVWAWKDKHGGIIINQLKKLGCSCDWTRERFTMDPEYSRCVQKVFVELYRKGLIYRGKRMVNWCPVSQTALSDEEVEMKPQKGFMYHFRVEVAEKDASIQPTARAQIQNRDGNLLLHLQQKVAQTGFEEPAKIGGPQIDPEGRVWLTIATTRPETIPGDTAVAVNPKDKRYAHLIGKHVIRPLPIHLPPEKKLIPIIGDEHVDFEFGTGVLKVTPAHDKADFDIGQRHNLPIVDVMNPDGTMNDLAGESLAGLDRFEARSVAVERLQELGAMVKEEPYENNVGFSQRADVPIEPRLSEQWFLKYPAMEQAKACVEMGSTGDSTVPPGNLPGGTEESTQSTTSFVTSTKTPRIPVGESPTGTGGSPVPPNTMRFHPQRWAKVYDHWLTNIQDWCISRQLWWGHQIPVWSYSFNSPEEFQKAELAYKYILLENCERNDIAFSLSGDLQFDSRFDKPFNLKETILDWFKKQEVKQGRVTICIGPDSMPVAKKLESEFGFTQDPDVLDTWFSSWLWPFATMGWPEQTDTLRKFYPTTDLVTGPDIIFFWVARMIMAGYEFMEDLPFRNVYFTGIIRDKQGRKMSKTLGNSPDPLELIAKYGADALRFGTMRSAPLGQDVLFDEKDVELGRNFCNKLWNACRFRQMVGAPERAAGFQPADHTSSGIQDLRQDAGSTLEVQGEINSTLLTSDDKWILLRLDQAIREIDTAFAEYKFSDATATLYRFFWSEYCDWYTEASKAALGKTEGGRQKAEQEPLRANKLAVIDFVLSHTLRLFHPFLPFITEELWHGMGYSTDMPEDQGGKTIMNAPWPKPFDADVKTYYGLEETAEKLAATKYELVSLGRNLKAQFGIGTNKKARFILKPAGNLEPAEVETIRLLLNAEELRIDPDHKPEKGTPVVANALGELFLPLAGQIDVEAEKKRLNKELEKARAEIAKVEAKLGNPNFTEKVPASVLDEHKQRLADWQAKEQQAQSSLANLPQ